MINAIAVDDEPLALELVGTYCSRIGYIDLKQLLQKLLRTLRIPQLISYFLTSRCLIYPVSISIKLWIATYR